MGHYLLYESALPGQRDVWSFQLQGYTLFTFLNRKAAITPPLGQLHLPWSFKMVLCQQIFMEKTTNTDEGNQCNTSSAIFFARNCFCGSCAAAMPRKSFPIQGGLRLCCWDRGCSIRGGPTAGEIQQTDWDYLPNCWSKRTTNVPCVLVNPFFSRWTAN